jgi:glutamate:GABA antiporter
MSGCQIEGIIMNTISIKPAATPRVFKRVLKRIDMLLFTVCAILIIDQLAASASIGVSSIFWWVFTLILFFIPYGMITAELASKYPEQGGIYAWVKRAYGPHWGARTSWLYWVNVALWMPSVYLLFSGMLAQILNIELGLWSQIGLAIVFTWVTVWVNIASLEIGKWVPNLGALFKAIIMLAIGVGGFWYASQHGVANDFSFNNMLPRLSDGLGFLPVIVYSFLGFELISGASEEMQNPEQDVIQSTVIAGILITVFYMLGTIGILIALPIEQISLVEGLIDTLRKIFGTSAFADISVFALGIAALYTLYANMVTWSMGANRSIAEASYRKDLPAVFGKMHPVNQTPRAAAIITGLVSTGVIVLYGLLAADAEDLFWTLFKFSTIIFLLPYLLMFPAYIRLRRGENPKGQAYTVPGGIAVVTVLAVICQLFIVQAIVLFVWVPGKSFWTYETLAIAIGTLLVLIVGEVLIHRAQTRATNSLRGTAL